MWRVMVMVLAMLPSVVLAEDGPGAPQLKKMYDDALVQLRSAQDRKNELANENESLKAKVAELSKTIEATRAQVEQLKTEAMASAEKTYADRAKLAAWQDFVQRHPQIAARWSVFLKGTVSASDTASELIDRDWPISTANASQISLRGSRAVY